MAAQTENEGLPSPRLGLGQVVLAPSGVDAVPSSQIRTLYRLSDPALSELGVEEFLEELLVRVRAALGVDTVAILLYDEENRQLVARAAQGIEEEVEQGVRIPIGQGFAGRIAAERVPIFIADVDHADILNPILRQKGIRSLLGVPLIVEGQLIGVLHVGALRPRTFTGRDVAVLQIAAARAAPGIERARLYSALEHEHRTAIMLQRSLLPRRLVEPVGVSTAVRYLPATDEVGGDWYDVFELPRGRLGVAIGDVVGHGVKAAALMGQLRTALRAYGAEGHEPARALALLDSFLQSLPEAAMATATYAVLDPEEGLLRVAAAGHLPPVVVSPGGARLLELPPAPPLGVIPFVKRDEHLMTLAPGEILVLYTDGLVERRGIPIDESIQQLVSILHSAGTPEEACQLAVDLVPVEGLRDDMAIVALQNLLVPEVLELEPLAEPTVLADVRRLLRRWLQARGAADDVTREITMAVNEACANAIEHAYSPAPARFRLRATEDGGVATIVVTDAGHWRDPRGTNRGRGLTIMRSAMDEVTVRPTEDGTEIAMRRRVSR
jgi:anti-sigma regulatory factor (Ser/Thr protein kinase)/putative methionine-R-sulfoxide reductase with GAF domain